MDRRTLLKRIALVAGAAYWSGETLAMELAQAAAARGENSAPEQPAVFPAAQMAALTALSELIIPTTESPGAIKAGVPAFIADMYAHWMTTAERKAVAEGLAGLDAGAVKANGKPFAECGVAQQTALFSAARGAAAGYQSRGFGARIVDPSAPFFFKMRDLITGGMAAKELTARGMKVLVLERGRPLEHQKDYKTEFTPPWDAPNRGQFDRDEIARDYPIQSKQPHGQFKWDNKHYWVKDSEQPYVQARPYSWIRADVLGGRSLLWGRQVYRWSDLDFEANKRDGHGSDWPIRYKDVAPWYTKVEKYIGVSGENLGLAHFPDMEMLPPMEMTAAEKLLREKIRAQWPERYLTIGRTVNLTKEHNGRGPCNYRNIRQRGCSFGAYFSSLAATLPDAQKTGLLTVKTNAVVHRVVTDDKTGRARGVEVIDAVTRERKVYTSRIVFLNAGTEASVQILLQSTDRRNPNGLGNRGDVLGRYICDHDGASAFGVLPGLTDRYFFGRRANGIYMPRFRNLKGGRDEGVDFDRGYVMQGGSARMGWADMAGDGDDFGAGFKKRLGGLGPWVVYLGGAVESLPRAENRITLDPVAKDRFGLPQLRFDVARGENENRMTQDALKEAKLMLQAAGAQNVMGMRFGDLPGVTVHVQGGARMGNDPTTSVLNAHNQVHGVPNVFVTDGAAMASAGAVNPSLTFMALTMRAVDYAVTQLKAGKL